MRPGRSPCSHRSISTAPLAGPQMWQISGSRVIRQMTRSGLIRTDLPEGRLGPVYEWPTMSTAHPKSRVFVALSASGEVSRHAPASAKSKRTLTMGGLTARYREWIDSLKRKGPDDWVFPQDEDATTPRWDSGVRKALKQAARAIRPDGADKDHPGLDFPGFGPHSLRRANITWRPEVGDSSIETSKIAGHASTAITEEYTFVELDRQDDLTRRMQDKRAKAARKVKTDPQPVTKLLAAQRQRARIVRSALKGKLVDMTKKVVA
jgi:hypothetical protein